MTSFILASIISLSSSVATSPQDSVITSKVVHNLSLTAGSDYIASSVTDELRIPVAEDERIFSHSALPVSFRYSFSFNNPKIRNYYPGGYQGIAAGVLNIGALSREGVHRASKNIGYPILAYIFQGAPFCRLSRNVTLDYEWNFGAALGWKPYGLDNYRFNLTVGSRVNAYLNLSLLLNWKIADDIAFFGGLAVSHFSNGNTSWPNPGVNSLGLRLGVILSLNPHHGNFQPASSDTLHKKRPEFDISLWGASRKRVYKGGPEPVLLKGHFACAGISFAPMWHLNPWWRLGGAADIQWDESSNLRKHYVSGSNSDDITFTRPGVASQISWGLSAHGELQMPVFAVNIGIGYNLIAPLENRGSYQNITLKTYILPSLFINVGYQLRNFHQQANLMLGLGLTL